MDAEAVVAMLREDRAEWEALVAVLEAHPGGPLHDASSPTWTTRDVYTHLARMMEGSTMQMEAKLAGRPVPVPWPAGIDEYEVNARIQQEYSHLSLQEAREWAQQAFERLLGAIEAVPTDRWDEGFEALARADGAEHFAGHRRYIVVAQP